MHKSLLIGLLLISSSAFSQWISPFDSLNLGSSGYLDGATLNGGFSSGRLYFVNQYNTQFQYWDGFAASSRTDTSTSGFSNQFSTYAGTARSGNQFALAYSAFPSIIRNTEPNVPKRLVSFWYTNSTYAALSMKNGDAFAKKFGGPSGNDPDYFVLKVLNFRNGIAIDTAEVFLADYRSSDNSQDYIVKNWRKANINFEQPFDSLAFRLESSDNGQFGMNTPAYFCLDDVETTPFLAYEERKTSELKIYPNPARESVVIETGSEPEFWSVFNSQGQKIQHGSLKAWSTERLKLDGNPSGMYQIRTSSGLNRNFVYLP
jgi:hypothetical protein